MSENDHAHKFTRFDLLQRVEHVVMLVSFTILAITGIAQKFSESSISLWIMRTLGGVENTRSIHHTSAIVLALVSIFHLVYLGYKLYVLRRRPSMLPTIKDFRDFVQLVSYNLGIGEARPKMEYFNFGEKIEYWAVVWGTLLMGVTGYVLWNPVVVTQFLPGEFVPAAKAAHGAEAILAILSILTWHVYHVHLKYFNRSMFTGKMSYHEMEEEHGAVLERVLAGVEDRPAPPSEVQWKRTRVYLPIAGLLTILFLLATYSFFTIENTAITTLPPTQYESVYVPDHPPGLPTATPASTDIAQDLPTRLPLPTPEPSAITSHPVDAERADCVACHHVYSYIDPAPLDHEGWENDGCQECHQPAQEVAQQ